MTFFLENDPADAFPVKNIDERIQQYEQHPYLVPERILSGAHIRQHHGAVDNGNLPAQDIEYVVNLTDKLSTISIQRLYAREYALYVPCGPEPLQ